MRPKAAASLSRVPPALHQLENPQLETPRKSFGMSCLTDSLSSVKVTSIRRGNFPLGGMASSPGLLLRVGWLDAQFVPQRSLVISFVSAGADADLESLGPS